MHAFVTSARRCAALSLLTLCAACVPLPPALAQAAPTATSAPATAPGQPFRAERLAQLLPPSVYFQGRTAALQVRNAGGTTFSNGAILWASLVDTSGYSTAVQERYQFYLVTEGALRIGDKTVPAGAYGGGFVGDRFVLMDVSGKTLAEAPLQNDAAMRRPRPLQIMADTPGSVKLYLGRRWVTLASSK
jgi:hypothetical protein